MPPAAHVHSMYTPPSSPYALQLKPTHAPRAVLAGGHNLRRSPGPRAADRRPSGASAGRTPADARAPMEPTGGRCGWCACSSRGLETELFLPALLDTHLSNGRFCLDCSDSALRTTIQYSVLDSSTGFQPARSTARRELSWRPGVRGGVGSTMPGRRAQNSALGVLITTRSYGPAPPSGRSADPR